MSRAGLGRPHRLARRQQRAALVAIALGVALPAPPAAADPPQPTDFRSNVTATEPELPPGVEVEVVGGDAFLQLTVAAGHEVVVPDYGAADPADRPPYLRFGPDGTVERNRSAAATAINDDRYGTGPTADADASPRWEVVARGGTYAWHDHRIHWMSPNPPRRVAADGTIDLGGPDGSWEVDLIVDGRPTTVRGSLALLDPPSPLPWLAAAAGVAALVFALLRRGHRRVVGALAVGASLGALGASWTVWTTAPAGSGARPLPVVVALVAAAASGALLALALASRGGEGGGRRWAIGEAVVAAALLGWGVARGQVLTRAVLPTSWPAPLDRGATCLAIGVGVALAIDLLAPRASAGTGVRSSRIDGTGGAAAAPPPT